MDRLLPNQKLLDGQELTSSNGWFTLGMLGDGGLALYRTQTHGSLWGSPTPSQPGCFAIMQTDGNLVACTRQGAPYWATGTTGQPGAAVVQDDGNLVVYDASGRPLWASNTVQDLLAPTIRYREASGYTYNETSESWKAMCASLPCFAALQWPGYATGVVDTVIDGEAVVIQWWKGWCQKFLGLAAFPGGMGVEVGVYRRMPGRPPPTNLSFVPEPFRSLLLDAYGRLNDSELWWPYPELGALVDCTVTNPRTGQVVFTGGPQRSYWLTKWMDEWSYTKYLQDQGMLLNPEDLVLTYRVKGRHPSQAPFTLLLS